MSCRPRSDGVASLPYPRPMETMLTGRRRTRDEWQRLVKSWRRSGKAAAAFVNGRDVVESTLRWWAWRLERDVDGAKRRALPALVPVRVVDRDAPAAVSATDDDARVAWTLRTERGELRVYAPTSSNELRAAVSALLGDNS